MALGVLGTTAAPAAEIWADEFDEWCDPDPSPGAGDGKCLGQVPNEAAAWDYYLREVACDSNYRLVSGTCGQNYDGDDGYGVKVFQNQLLVRHAHDMTAEIVALPGNTLNKTAVNGSGVILDQLDPSYVDPDTIATVLKGEFKFHTNNQANQVSYVELCAEDDRAPVNFNMFNCFTQYEGYPGPETVPNTKGIWRSPILITTDGTPHASFALGSFALIDPYNCNLEAGHFCTEYTPVAFDGLTWVVLDLPDFDSGVSGCKWDEFKYFIGTDYIEIRFKPGDDDWVRTRIERQYKGPFNQIAMGPPQGVEQSGVARCERAEWDNSEACVGGPNNGDPCDSGSATPVADQCPPSIGTCAAGFCAGGANHGNACSTPGDCPDYEECLWVPRGIEKNQVNAVNLDEFLLADGIPDWPGTIPGACCERDGGCVENKTQTECEALDGEYKGGDTDCAGVTCTGACCLNPDGSCQDSKTEEQCVDTLAGSYSGGGSTCAAVDCGGACCLPDATCEFKSPAGCIAVSGEFTFLGAICDDVVCGGACCLPNATCQQAMTETDCDTLSGQFQGLGIACDDVLCCVNPFADADADGDVDQNDFAMFQACFTGSGPATVVGACECLDVHTGADDPDVDEDDWGAFENCASGPDVPADPACDG